MKPSLSKSDIKVIERTFKHFGLSVDIPPQTPGCSEIVVHGYHFSVDRETRTESREYKSLRGTRTEEVEVDGWNLTKWVDGEDYFVGWVGSIEDLVAEMTREAAYYRATCVAHEEAMAEQYAHDAAVPHDTDDRPGISWSPQHGFERAT